MPTSAVTMSPPINWPSFVDEKHAVGVAVEGDAQIAAVLA